LDANGSVVPTNSGALSGVAACASPQGEDRDEGGKQAELGHGPDSVEQDAGVSD
jgi:hypothetical protein